MTQQNQLSLDPTIFYQDIRCQIQSDVSVGFLMSRLMGLLHLQFVRISAGESHCPIGVSFPEYRSKSVQPDADSEDEFDRLRMPPIGGCLRLFSRSEQFLQDLNLFESLVRLHDYVLMSEIRPLKRRNFGWARYKRYQPHPTQDRLVRRRMKRKGVSQEEATMHFATAKSENHVSLPYVDMISKSSRRSFRLFIIKEDVSVDSVTADFRFSSYGLSSTAAVPDF